MMTLPARAARIGTAGLLAVAVAGCSGSSESKAVPDESPAAPAAIAGVHQYPGLSHDHAAKPQTYPQTPPVGGPHWPPKNGTAYGWQACATYDQPVVNEFAVHSLEHGAVWLTYLPGTPAARVQTLTALAAIRPHYVLVSPYPGQTAPITATAWGLQLTATTADDPRLAEFTRTYAGGAQGNELGADCAHGSTLPQAQAALKAAH